MATATVNSAELRKHEQFDLCVYTSGGKIAVAMNISVLEDGSTKITYATGNGGVVKIEEVGGE